jgi:hypothetical protein
MVSCGIKSMSPSRNCFPSREGCTPPKRRHTAAGENGVNQLQPQSARLRQPPKQARQRPAASLNRAPGEQHDDRSDSSGTLFQGRLSSRFWPYTDRRSKFPWGSGWACPSPPFEPTATEPSAASGNQRRSSFTRQGRPAPVRSACTSTRQPINHVRQGFGRSSRL